MRLALPTCLALTLAACTGVASLDRPTRALEGEEPSVVRRRSDEALQAKEWSLAWNMEVQAGADRARLETIALAALDADSGDAADMIDALRAKHGGLTDAGKARVKEVAAKHEAAGEWKAAAQTWITAADDAPKYSAAWDVYARTPVKQALGVLDRIQKARSDWDAAHGDATKPKDGK